MVRKNTLEVRALFFSILILHRCVIKIDFLVRANNDTKISIMLY